MSIVGIGGVGHSRHCRIQKGRGGGEIILTGARRRRSGGGPGGGCVRMPVGTYLYLHALGASNPVAVPCLAR
jgi:hypothetical protein